MYKIINSFRVVEVLKHDQSEVDHKQMLLGLINGHLCFYVGKSPPPLNTPHPDMASLVGEHYKYTKSALSFSLTSNLVHCFSY